MRCVRTCECACMCLCCELSREFMVFGLVNETSQRNVPLKRITCAMCGSFACGTVSDVAKFSAVSSSTIIIIIIMIIIIMYYRMKMVFEYLAMFG